MADDIQELPVKKQSDLILQQISDLIDSGGFGGNEPLVAWLLGYARGAREILSMDLRK